MTSSYHDPATARLLMQEDEPYAFHSNDDKEKDLQEASITGASHIIPRLTISLVLACIASSILLAFAVTVALRDMRMIISIERAVDNYLDTTNRTYGFATPPPTSIDVEGAPKRATLPENATFIFPRSIDLVNTQHADEIYTGNRNVIITHSTSTVVQFVIPESLADRKICRLSSVFPSREYLGSKTMTISLPVVEVWALQSSKDIDDSTSTDNSVPPRAKFTHRNLPPRSHLLGKVTPVPGEYDHTVEFYCPRVGQTIALELACDSDVLACLLAIDQDFQTPTTGFGLTAFK